MIEVGAACPEALAWLAKRLGLTLTPQARGIQAWRDGEIIACVAYDMWTVNAVFAHMLVTQPIAWRRLLPLVFQAPFETRQILLGMIRSDNPRSLEMALSLGFRETHRTRDGGAPGVDLVWIEMRRDECRWLRPEGAQ